MTDRPSDSDNPGADQPAPGTRPEQGAQPEQGWSSAQQYPFHPQGAYGGYPPAGSYVQDGPYRQYVPAAGEQPGQLPGPYGYGQGYGQQAYGQAYGQHGYGQQYPYGYQPTGQFPAGQQAGQHSAGQHPAGPYPLAAGGGSYGGGPHGPYGGSYPPGPNYWAPPPVAARSRSHKLVYGTVAAAVAAALAIGGVALAVDHSSGSNNQQTSLSTPTQQGPLSGNGNNGNGLGLGNGFGNGGNGNSNGSNGSSGSTGTTGTASSTQSVGIVDINTVIDYGQGKAAGTGMVLTSNGEILTNNHVVQDSTSISVTVVSTGKTYTATVVGTDPTDDVAVIQLKDASGLSTAKLGGSVKVAAGNAVTAVGNAGGTGGTPTAATGTVSAVNQSITASDDSGANAERLTGMIEVNANIQPGDSGGALYDDATGSIIGMNTAASSSATRFGGTAASTTGFAIPIAKATSIADQIESGVATSTIHIGYPAFLGVQLAGSAQSQTGAALIGGVIKGTAAATAGLAAGDTITSVDGKAISTATELSTATKSHKPGDQIKIGYVDSSGASHTVTVTLGSGPAD